MLSAVAAAALCVGLAGCSGGEDEPSPDQQTGEAAPSDPPTDTDEQTGDPTASPSPDSEDETDTPTEEAEPEPERDPLVQLEDQEGAREDLTDFVCEPNDGSWGAAGTLTNPTDADLTYVVNVGVIEDEGGSSLVRRNIIADVAAGEEVEIEDLELVSTDRDDVRCVVRVNRGTGTTD